MRDTENATTGLPSSSATCVGSATESLMRASVPSRTARPSGKVIAKFSSSRASLTVAIVRSTCCPPPTSDLPLGRSTCERASCAFTAPAVVP
ncbi:hypothetical protein ACVWWW_000148 [Lysobacter sp. HA18]